MASSGASQPSTGETRLRASQPVNGREVQKATRVNGIFLEVPVEDVKEGGARTALRVGLTDGQSGYAEHFLGVWRGGA